MVGRPDRLGPAVGSGNDLELDDGRAGEPVRLELRPLERARQELDAIQISAGKLRRMNASNWGTVNSFKP
jgi:hypothetical protein